MQIRAKKSLGQHFLNSKHVLEQIIAAAKIRPGETILEIGPGTGVLTSELLQSNAHVISVEKDNRAIDALQEKFSKEIADQRLKLIYGDVLDPDLLVKQSLTNSNYAIVANIPYYITGSILEKFLEHEPRPSRMILLVQKEVADRIVARDNKESILSISVKAFGTPSLVAKVPPGAFTPPPTVDSAILAIESISNTKFLENTLDVQRFFEIVRAGFAHKRKLLIRNLETVIDMQQLKTMWQNLNLSEKVRAEDLERTTWFDIAKLNLR